jgi:hypothetical protein
MAIAVADLITDIRDDLDEPVEAVWKDTALLSWINSGIVRVGLALRAVREDHLTKRMTSSDSALLINGVSYDPTSFRIVSGTEIYTLPPDLVEIRRIMPADDADIDDGIRFTHRDMSRPDFDELDRVTDTSDSRTTYVYDLFGVNSMRVVPEPDRTINLELFYVRYANKYALADSIDILPDYAEEALRAYVVYRAYRAISHTDKNDALQLYREAERAVKSMGRPRQSNDITIVDDFFAGDLEDFGVPRFDPTT